MNPGTQVIYGHFDKGQDRLLRGRWQAICRKAGLNGGNGDRFRAEKGAIEIEYQESGCAQMLSLLDPKRTLTSILSLGRERKFCPFSLK